MRTSPAITSITATAVLTLTLAGCGGPSTPAEPPASATTPLAAASIPAVPADFSLLPPDDFSSLDRVAAFTALHERVKTDYAFTEWKGLDLDGIYSAVLPDVSAAAKADDPQAYLLALREYASEFWDGHVRVAEDTEGKPLTAALTTQQSGGALGLGLLRLDDGRVVVAAVTPGGPAAKAGITPGAIVSAWNGTQIDEAIAAVDVARHVDAPAIATTEYREREQVRLLSRVPIGSTVTVTLASQADPITLTAVDDAGAGLHLVDVAHPLTAAQEASYLPEVKVLDGGVGYIQLGWLADLSNLAGYPQAIADAVADAITSFHDAPGIVIDMRANHGGTDQLGADICGHFVTDPRFYERTQFFDATHRDWVTLTIDLATNAPTDATLVTPQPEQFAGPVVVLANPRTVSSGEGVTQCIAKLPQGTAVGINGTRASYGIANGEIPMPDGLVFHYPNGRSVDAEGVIQLDSRDGVGGVAPEVRVPITIESALALGRGEDIEVAAALTLLGNATAE